MPSTAPRSIGGDYKGGLGVRIGLAPLPPGLEGGIDALNYGIRTVGMKLIRCVPSYHGGRLEP